MYELERQRANDSWRSENAGHHFIPRLFGHPKGQKSVYLLTENIMGGELFSLLDREAPLPESRVAFYAAQVVLVLEALHGLSYVYGDLEPENILVDLY